MTNSSVLSSTEHVCFPVMGNYRPVLGICVISTPTQDSLNPVSLVLPYRGSYLPYDDSLCNRSGFLPEGYLFSVKVYDDQFLHVKHCCHTGSCSCVYYLDGVPSPLKPCRIAALMVGARMFSEEDTFVLSGVCRGFKIVDNDVNL